MRVLHIAPERDAETGIAPYAERFRAGLAQVGVDVEPFSYAAGHMHSVADIRAYSAAALSVSHRGFDVVHVELGGGALRQFYALRRLQGAGAVPLVATLHDPPGAVWWPFSSRAVLKNRASSVAVRLLLGRAAARLEDSVINNLDELLVLTGAGAAAVAAHHPGISAQRVTRLPYPIDPDPGDRAPSTGCLVVGFFGYWYPGKGLELLIRAVADTVARGVPVSARLWGEAPSANGSPAGARYRRAILSQIRQSGLTEHVEVLGYLDDEQVRDELRRCDVVALPYELSRAVGPLRSTSAAMYEALAVGTPVIASDVKGLGEAITSGVNGLLFEAGDADALSRSLQRLYAEPELLARLRDGAHACAASLSLSGSGAIALRTYTRACGHRRSRRQLQSDSATTLTSSGVRGGIAAD